jgi:hypothetical protein
MKRIYEILESFINVLKNKKGFTTQDVATGLTLAVVVGTIAVVTGNTVVLDVEESAHVQNAKAFSSAAQTLINDGTQRDFILPDSGGVVTITLADLKTKDLIQNAIDPSATGNVEYNLGSTKINCENQDGDYVFYVKLVDSGGSYAYEDDLLTNDTDRMPSGTLDRSRIAIPKRDPDGR